MYGIMIRMLCFVHNVVYYRRFVVKNIENIPPRGVPTFVIANHQNGMMDAMAILHTLYHDRRQPVFIARGDIFKKDSVARVLRFLKILPVFRKRDGGRDDIEKDIDIFRQASKVLCNGGTLVIFPEAGHQQGHYMNTFKKGFSRIAFMAEEMSDFKLGVKILPLNIHYTDYFEFRSDLLVTCGEPFTFEEFFQQYKESPNQAYISLNEKARARVKSMTPDIDIPEHYKEIEAITRMTSEHILLRKGDNIHDLPAQKDAMMETIAAVKELRNSDGPVFERLMGNTKEYMQLAEKLKVEDWAVNREVSAARLSKWMALALVFSPFALFGFLNNLVPSTIIGQVNARIEDPMMHSTFRYALGTAVAVPLWYVLVLLFVWLVSRSLVAVLVYLSVAAVCGLFFPSYRRNFWKLVSVVRMRMSGQKPGFKRLSALKSEIFSIVEPLLF